MTAVHVSLIVLVLFFILIAAMYSIINDRTYNNYQPEQPKPSADDISNTLNFMLQHGIITPQQLTEYTRKTLSFL